MVDTARAILDGHIVLSRELAQQGLTRDRHTASVSRVMPDVTGAPAAPPPCACARWSRPRLENRDLVLMGGYVAGQDATLDVALRLWPRILALAPGQDRDTRVPLADSHAELAALLGPEGG